MTTAKGPVHTAYVHGVEERRASPLPSGKYKLDQRTAPIHSWREELTRIVRLRPTGVASCSGGLLHSTSADATIWVRQIPVFLGQILGKDIVPAALALTGDGLGEKEARKLHEWATAEAKRMVERAEEVRYGIPTTRRALQEYLSNGSSPLHELLDDVIAVAKTIRSHV